MVVGRIDAVATRSPSGTTSSLATGVGRVLIAVYGILALAATGRSVVQIAEKFSFAPFSYVLSAVAAVAFGALAYLCE